MRRLYLQIYATLVLVLVLFAAAWSWVSSATLAPHEAQMMNGMARIAGDLLPPAGAPRADVEAVLARIGESLLSDVALFDANGAALASTGAPIPAADVERARRGETRGTSAYLFRLPLADGRFLVARHAYAHGHLEEISGAAVLLAILAAIGAFPLVRRTTRRLERLRDRVEALGAGDLAARVEVEGRDEVGALAQSFNRAAQRIERLVEAQRTLLAGVSHELRSPLARIRVAAELAGDAHPELRGEIERSVAELDAGIGELLLASRLDAQPPLAEGEEIDLLALAAEEAARSGADVSGAPVRIRGDARLLRRLIRNLLENARRHGGGAAVEVSVAQAGDGRAALCVDDRGPGVPEPERERIFEPFYRPTGSRETTGLGLGLALVRRIARHHGGDARCLARPGGGTRFEVVL
jgi:signal transduction histidine kinase